MENEKRLIDAIPLMQDGWHLVKTGKSNAFLASMSLADVPTVNAVEVVHGKWKRSAFRGEHKKRTWEYFCSECKTLGSPQWKCCPVCTALMDGGNEDG